MEIEFSPEKLTAFEALYQHALTLNGGVLDYTLPYPKHEFLQFVVERKPVILHGSNDASIEMFVPQRNGMDANPHGNVMGVYGTADGVWPIFFAVLSKKNYRGSMRNGVGWMVGEDDIDFALDAGVRGARKVYEFSLNAEQLDKPIWQTGALYLLPSATFEQQRLSSGLLSPEWVSRQPVKPIARLAVEPDDFPYRTRVSGHDDAYMFRMYALLQTFFTARKQTAELPNGYAFEIEWERARANEVMEFIDLTRANFPVCTVELRAEAQKGPVWLRLEGPETFKNVLGREMKKLEVETAQVN